MLWQEVFESYGVIVKQRMAPRKCVWDSSGFGDGRAFLVSMNICKRESSLDFTLYGGV